MKLITKEMAGPLMAAYAHSAETGEGGKTIIAKFFTPWAGATWYITEGIPVDEKGGEPIETRLENLGDPNDYDWHLFGWCDLGDPAMAELGYVMLSDLKGLRGPGGLKVERDLHYSGTMAEVLADYGRAAA